MAIDNTPPRLKLIITIACIAIVTLISLDFVLKSYYAYMSDTAQREKLAPTTDLDNHKKAEAESLAKAKIDSAMGDVAKGARAAAITPQQSDDLGAMTGWSKLPKAAPIAPPHAAFPVAMDAGVDGGDGGGAPTTTMQTKDGGTVAVDAGAPKH